MDLDFDIRSLSLSIFIFLWLALPACSGKKAMPTAFIPPTSMNIPNATLQSVIPTVGTVISQPFSPSTIPTPACTVNLHFITDLTVPDGTVFAPGILIDKQWQVENNGSCNWDDRYSLRFLGGDALGAPPQQALYPALSGTQAVIRILFTAPLEEGNYRGVWQAHDPQGQPFGDPLFIEIDVQS